MKVKELSPDINLKGVRVQIPKKFTNDDITGKMYIEGIWNAGVWFKKTLKDSRIYPAFFVPKEVLEFTVVK